MPDGIDVAEVEKAIGEVNGVLSVHDLHIWSLTSGKSSLTAHVVHDPEREAASTLLQALQALQEVLALRFNVFHTTLQLETTPCQHTADGCNYVARNPSTDEDADPC